MSTASAPPPRSNVPTPTRVARTDERTASIGAGASGGHGRALVVGLSLLVALAALLYAPWIERPIGLSDFGEYVPFLRRAGSFGPAFVDLTRYYATANGRFTPMAFAGIAFKWAAFGESPRAWYALRFVQMSGLVALAALLFRRLGASTVGALAGAALFVFAGTAWQGWIVLSIGEPLGLVFLLLAAVVAADYRHSARPGVHLAAIALLVLAALLTKEMLVAAVPFVGALALFHVGDGRFARPRRDATTAALVASLTVVVALVGVVVLWVARHGNARGYVSPYTLGNASVYKFVRLLGGVALPVWPAADERVAALALNGGFVALVWTGLRGAFVDPRTRRQAQARIAVALLPVVVGLTLYQPWPNFAALYGMPMLLGPALLLAWACTAHGASDGAMVRRVAAGAAAVVLVGTAGIALRHARAEIAHGRVTDRLTVWLGAQPAARAFVFATQYTRPAAWASYAATLAQYARATHGTALPPARDADCVALAQPGALPAGTVLVSDADDCGPLATPTVSFREPYLSAGWLPPRIVTRDLRLDAQLRP